MRGLLPFVSAALLAVLPAQAQEVRVVAGLDDTIAWLESIDWWGGEISGDPVMVPHSLLTGLTQEWREGAPEVPVPVKKEMFYRLMLPLVVHANEMVLDRRARSERADAMLARGEWPSEAMVDSLRNAAVLLRIKSEEEAAALKTADEFRGVIKELLYRLDVIPAGLALGQAAYESGYGTSRFAVEGQAIFGQWTFGGEGLVPEQQREDLGDHRIAAFDWLFDSVRGYFLNLSSHPAYEDFRRLRAELKAAGKPVTSLALADGLTSYSERGQEYVDDLKGIIRVNKLDRMDSAVMRDEPISFVLGAGTEETAVEYRARIEEMRQSGELDKIVARMRLE